ncbi:MAG: GTP 3',8-cyclase MoaA [Eubacterium sp.]|nr:GTP 3',8-cyclase MoaA [Eubacterium sp.]MDD7209351.1 GTP 3',8-cyclase MoaA [Lachnospiraceae bacterium]MDY5497568.1 GTP 3',8-cyclase MoaA [Anaerobutyricum sp.]
MIDKFGRDITYLRLSVTERCNLRCRYCMPEDGICKKKPEEMLTEKEMIQAVWAASSLGITKVRITGGEPLIKSNIISICKKTMAVPDIQEVCITTNGILLPKLAKPLKEAGVTRINISLDTLDEEKYAFLTRTGHLDKAIDGLKAALEAGFEKIKINTVLLGGFNDDEIPTLAGLTKKYPVDVRFIELMPMYDGGDFGPEAYIPHSIVTEKLPDLEPIKSDGGVAKLFKFPDGKGNIGLISPVNAHFCKSCNRLRLTADGKLKPCLHSGDEFSIKGMNFLQMKEQMEKAILEKPAYHGELSYYQRSNANRNMNQIGG